MVSDREILALLKDCNKVAFDYLYDKYAARLYGWITELTDDVTIACDLLKRSFVDIWSNIRSYDPAKTTLFTWMLQVTMKNCISVLHLTPKKMNEQIRKLNAGFS